MKRTEVYLSQGDADTKIGVLEFDELRGKEISSFELDAFFFKKPVVSFLGPDIGFFRGKQYPVFPSGFGLFQDAAPDSWGRKIIRRREKRGNLRESDYLLGVFDLTRVGALRFKMEGSDYFLNCDGENPAPPWTMLRALEDSSRRFENDDSDESAIAMLLRPGTSLGGARPKASVTAPDGSLCLSSPRLKLTLRFLDVLLDGRAGLPPLLRCAARGSGRPRMGAAKRQARDPCGTA